MNGQDGINDTVIGGTGSCCVSVSHALGERLQVDVAGWFCLVPTGSAWFWAGSSHKELMLIAPS